jgi:hypothetical protein
MVLFEILFCRFGKAIIYLEEKQSYIPSMFVQHMINTDFSPYCLLLAFCVCGFSLLNDVLF